MKNILDSLTQLGFSKTEANFYIILLKSGPMTVAELAEKAKLHRTAAYSHIDSLMEKGVLAKTTGAGSKIVANPPEHLYYLLEQKANEIKTLQTKLPTVISALNTSFLQQKIAYPSEIKYYKGKTGVKNIYQECTKAKEIRSYFNQDDVRKIFPENGDLLHAAFTHNLKLVIHEIVEYSTLAVQRMNSYKENKRHLYKFLPKDIKITANDILIYDGKVAIINVGDKNNVTGVVLSNKDYYNNSVQLFNLLWRLLPESN
ncbi:MAG: helix-turn-helix domain-containing protein [Patescibacteria group bacterium]